MRWKRDIVAKYGMVNDLRRWMELMEGDDLYASSTWDIVLPSIFYRASKTAISSSYLTRLWRHPDAALPSTINQLLNDGTVDRVSGLSSNTPFKISRTYSGMSNWGFGAYFASDLDWARRYGDCVTAVSVEPQAILAIRADDFAQRVTGTPGGELHRRLTVKAGDRMADQASAMGAVVRGMKRTARALYVATEAERGQICVFGVQAIYPRFYFEIKSGLTENGDRRKGKSLPETGHTDKFVTIYRAVLATVMGFQPMDYVTLNRRWAIEHAEHVAAVEGENATVLRALVPAKDVYEAYNPGEYFYDGPAITGRPITGAGMKPYVAEG